MTVFRRSHPHYPGYYWEPGGMEPGVPFCIGCHLAFGTGHDDDCNLLPAFARFAELRESQAKIALLEAKVAAGDALVEAAEHAQRELERTLNPRLDELDDALAAVKAATNQEPQS